MTIRRETRDRVRERSAYDWEDIRRPMCDSVYFTTILLALCVAGESGRRHTLELALSEVDRSLLKRQRQQASLKEGRTFLDR